MKKLKFKQIIIENFKGIDRLEINDMTDIVNIYGYNETGKSTIKDAISFLWTGKDSKGSADFSIKPLDENNNVKHKLESSVYALIDKDGEKMELKRVYREVWRKKHGNTENELIGHETLFFGLDGIKLTKGEYEKTIESILPQLAFKLLSDPLALNSKLNQKLPDWMVRRDILFELAGTISNREVAADNQEFINILEVTKGDLYGYKKKITTKRNDINKELKLIPGRVDENKRMRPEVRDWEFIRLETIRLKNEIKSIDNQIEDSNKGNDALNAKIQEKKIQILGIQNKIDDLRQLEQQKINSGVFERQEAIKSHERKITSLEAEFNDYIKTADSRKGKIKDLDEQINKLREKWKTLNSSKFSYDSNLICPIFKKTCDSSLIDSEKENFQVLFNENKQRKLSENISEGKKLIELKKQLETELKDSENAVIENRELIKSVKSEVEKLKAEDNKPIPENEDSLEVIQLISKMEQIKQTIPEVKTVDNSKLKANKEELQTSLKAYELQLKDQETITNYDKRLEEINQKERDLSQQISDLDKQEDIIKEFTKAKISMVEENINSKFDRARFKMYETVLSSDEESETCITLCDGVPFSDANSAKQNFVGIDIINTLSKHYGWALPFCIDNREGIINIPKTESQVINLIVSKDDMVLRIENV